MMQNVNREIEKMMKNAIVTLASKYCFDPDEGMRMIWESEGLTSSSRSRNKKVSNKKEKREVVKSAFPLPYNGEMNGECCFGIRQNSGLYTQCPSIRPEGGAYCGSCDKQAAKNEHGLPDYGNIQTRSSKYLKDEEFVDPSGKKPVAYTKIMKKLKLTEEQVREEAAKHNMTLDPRHFIEVEKKSGRPAKEPKEPKEQKAKGRPKKSKKVLELAGEEEDLFASLVMAANITVEDIIEETVTSESEADLNEVINSSLGDVDVVVDAKPSKTKTEKKPKVSPEEKAALAEQKKQALAEQKKQEAEQKKQEAEQKKQEAEQKKQALAEQKKLEAEQKKLEAEQKKQALAEQKKLEAEQKKLALEKEKEAKKFLKELEKQEKQAIAEIKKENKEKKETKKETKKESKVEAEEEADVVKKIDFEGKKYLKSKKTGIIYNMDQDVIGKWNESKQRIDFDETGEESEEDYDEDDN
jgi:hypothetical protein